RRIDEQGPVTRPAVIQDGSGSGASEGVQLLVVQRTLLVAIEKCINIVLTLARRALPQDFNEGASGNRRHINAGCGRSHFLWTPALDVRGERDHQVPLGFD